MIRDYQLQQRLREAIIAEGGKDVPRVYASLEMAVERGDDIDEMIASLRKWQPELFGRPPKPKRVFTDATKPSRESPSETRFPKDQRKRKWDW
jgi:hypothetical protein